MEKSNITKKGILGKVTDAKETDISKKTENTYGNILDKIDQIDMITKELKLNIVDFQIQEEKKKNEEKLDREIKKEENKIEKKVPSFRIEVKNNSKNNQKNDNQNYHNR